MPLRGEQRALLQLLCERGQSYQDISGLLGSTPEEVRENARAALEEIGGSDPDADVGLTDFLMGQADPIGRADAARYLQSDPETLDLAKRIEAGLRLLAPEASLPKLPEPRGKRARAAIPAAGEELEPAAGERRSGAEPIAGRSGARTTPTQNRMIMIIAAAGVILIVAILAVAGVFSGNDDTSSGTSSPEASTGTGTDATTPNPDDQRTITTVKLSPSGGSGVAGTAKFGIVNGSQVVVDVDLNGLPQVSGDKVELAWLMVGPSGGYPINSLDPDANGNFAGSLAVPTAVASIVGSQATAVKVSLSSKKETGKVIKQAATEQVPIVGFTGTELASGQIPKGRQTGG